MRVTFLAIGSEQLAVSQLAALARAHGHTPALAFEPALFDDRYYFRVPRLAEPLADRAHVLAEIERQRPDVLACSVLTNTYRWMLDIAGEARRRVPGLQVLFGGVHPSALPEKVLARAEVDAVCVGEGDLAFPAYLDALERGALAEPIPNLHVRLPDGRVVRGPQAPFVSDLDALPWFDKTLWEEHVRVADVYLTMASRGCPYRCTFCFNNFFARLPEGPGGKYVRQRGVDHVMGELLAARKRYGRLRYVNFQDDVFTVDKAWLAPFLARYRREIGAPFRCLSHPKYVDDDVARWLAEAGCVWTQLGVQSVDDAFKYGELKRYERTSDVERALDALARHGIRVQVDHIFGLPGEPEGAQERARALYAAHPPRRISTFWATYFPGTEFLAQGLEAGLITPADVARIEDGDLDSYHNSGFVGQGVERQRMLKAYDVLFRLFPLLPAPLRRHLGAGAVARLPAPLWLAAGMAADMLAGLGRHRYEERTYLRHYVATAVKIALRRLGLPTWRATRPVAPDGATALAPVPAT